MGRQSSSLPRPTSSRAGTAYIPRNEVQNAVTRGLDDGIRRPVGSLVEGLPTTQEATDSIAHGLQAASLFVADMSTWWSSRTAPASAEDAVESREPALSI